MMINKKYESTTINIDHLTVSANFKVVTFNKNYSGLIGWSFEMPNALYSKR